MLGLGTSSVLDQDTLTKVKDFYRDAGIKKYFLHIYPESMPEGGNNILEELGFIKSRGWMKFRRDNKSDRGYPAN